jgi:hypothetical protein
MVHLGILFQPTKSVKSVQKVTVASSLEFELEMCQPKMKDDISDILY